jgi:hypothetical protein
MRKNKGQTGKGFHVFWIDVPKTGYVEVGRRRGGWTFLAASSVRLVRWFLPAVGPTNQPRDDHLTGGARQTGQLAFSSCVSAGSNSGCGVGEHDCGNKRRVACCGIVGWGNRGGADTAAGRVFKSSQLVGDRAGPRSGLGDITYETLLVIGARSVIYYRAISSFKIPKWNKFSFCRCCVKYYASVVNRSSVTNDLSLDFSF